MASISFVINPRTIYTLDPVRMLTANNLSAHLNLQPN